MSVHFKCVGHSGTCCLSNTGAWSTLHPADRRAQKCVRGWGGPSPLLGGGSAKAGTCLALKALFAIVVVVTMAMVMAMALLLRGGQGRGGEKAHHQHCRHNLGVHRGLLQGTQHVHTQCR